MLSEKSMMDELSLRVKVVNYYICIATVTSREDYYFEVFGKGSKDLNCVWTDVDASLDFLSCGKFYCNLNVMRGS